MKNCINCFDVTGPAEDMKDVFLAGWGVKDVRGCNHFGHQSELIHDAWGVFANSSTVAFSVFIASSFNVTYSYYVRGCNNLFGCVGLRNKSYCIFNKQYSKEEYEKLREKIIEQMKGMFYADGAGRQYSYGQFFPAEISPFAYNETIAQEYFPLTKDQANERGLAWKEPEDRNPKITVESSALPKDIGNVGDEILEESIHCEHAGECEELCTKAFKLIPSELQFYRRLNLPLPRLCHSCRHYQRFRKRNPIKLWHRKCQCTGVGSENALYRNTGKHNHANDHCPNEFETSYAPDRPEIVYCEECYQREVA